MAVPISSAVKKKKKAKRHYSRAKGPRRSTAPKPRARRKHNLSYHLFKTTWELQITDLASYLISSQRTHQARRPRFRDSPRFPTQVDSSVLSATSAWKTWYSETTNVLWV